MHGDTLVRIKFEGAKLTMTDKTSLYLVDSDWRRRALITSQFAASGFHIEPFDGAAEFALRPPAHGVVFVHDEPGLLKDLTNLMAANGRWLAVVCFADAPAANQVVQAIMSGACDFVTLPLEASDIAATITAARDCLEAKTHGWLRRSVAQSQIDRLTKREREVLNGVTDGLSNRLIAKDLEISPRTVEIHRANMLSKLEARGTSDAIRIAFEART